jgi:hypothetical protein
VFRRTDRRLKDYAPKGCGFYHHALKGAKEFTDNKLDDCNAGVFDYYKYAYCDSDNENTRPISQRPRMGTGASLRIGKHIRCPITCRYGLNRAWILVVSIWNGSRLGSKR